MPAKLPAEERGEIVQFRYPKKKAKKLDKFAKTHGFKNKSKFVYWSVELGQQILSGDMQVLETIFKTISKPEDPRQKDLWDEMMIQGKAEVYARISQAMKELPEEFREIAQRHLES